MANPESADYDNFVTDLQEVVAQRVEELRARQAAEPPPAFLDDEKVVRDWPELAGRVIEELR